MGKKKRRGPLGRLWKRLRTAGMLSLGPAIIAGLVRLLRYTSRTELVNYEGIDCFWKAGERVLIAFWHGRMLMLPPMLPRDRRIGVLISQHRDGELITRVLRRFGIDSVRGSATRGGLRAVREMCRRVGEGWDLAVTPDGPRGPAFQVKSGVVELARLTRLPIVPVTYSASNGWRMKSWDRFLLPAPGGKLVYVIGNAIRVEENGGAEGVTQAIDLLTLELDRINTLADALASGGRSVAREGTGGGPSCG